MKLRILCFYPYLCFFCIFMHTPVFSKNIEIPLNWEVECVGRAEMKLPTDAEVAGYSYNRLAMEVSYGAGQQLFQFADGENAGWSRARYDGFLSISNILSNHEILQMREKFISSKENLKRILKNSKNPDDVSVDIGDVKSNFNNVTAWYVSTAINAFIQLDQHVLIMKVDEYGKGLDESRKRFGEVVLNASFRPIYSVPVVPGVCVPYAFIKDDGKRFRNMVVTYRLSSHPDITVILKDASAARYDNPIREKNAHPASVINNFWAQFSNEKVKSLASIWSTLHRHRVKFGTQDGIASFVKIIRKDDSTDYGYMAAVRGDPDAKEDTPDMHLVVIRNASRARAKGIEPMGEKEFLNLAETIAASVKRRPTQ